MARSATCDKCGVGMSAATEPTVLKAEHWTINIDLCTFCSGQLRMDMLVLIEQWDEALREEEVDDADAA